MSNEIKSGNMNDQSGVNKQDPNRATGASDMNAHKSGQQSQGSPPRTDKGMPQQGGSDHKSGQQSQGGSQPGGSPPGAARADDDGMKQAGSATTVNDPKKTSDSTQKSAQPK
jgi:hypothetical protein